MGWRRKGLIAIAYYGLALCSLIVAREVFPCGLDMIAETQGGEDTERLCYRAGVLGVTITVGSCLSFIFFFCVFFHIFPTTYRLDIGWALVSNPLLMQCECPSSWVVYVHP